MASERGRRPKTSRSSAPLGIKIPSGALQAILSGCARRGLVKKQHRVYMPEREGFDELECGPLLAEALRQHRCLLDKLREFRLSASYEDQANVLAPLFASLDRVDPTALAPLEAAGRAMSRDETVALAPSGSPVAAPTSHADQAA